MENRSGSDLQSKSRMHISVLSLLDLRKGSSVIFTGPLLLQGRGRYTERAPQDRRVCRVACDIEEGHHVRELPDVWAHPTGQAQHGQGHVKHPYFLPTGLPEPLEGFVEGDGVGAGELVASVDFPLKAFTAALAMSRTEIREMGCRCRPGTKATGPCSIM